MHIFTLFKRKMIKIKTKRLKVFHVGNIDGNVNNSKNLEFNIDRIGDSFFQLENGRARNFEDLNGCLFLVH